jgi:hypothetical protein
MRTRTYLKRYGSRVVRPNTSALLDVFRRLNRDVFDGAVPEPTRIQLVEEANRDKWLAVAYLHHSGDWYLGFTDDSMTINSAYDLLAHEMVHAHLWSIDGDRRTNHGPAFMAWAPQLALEGIILKERHYGLNH